MNNKAYYTGKGFSVEEVYIIKHQCNRYLIYNNGDLQIVPYWTCFTSKEDAIKEVLTNFQCNVKLCELDLYQAQDALSMTKDELQKFKEKYAI